MQRFVQNIRNEIEKSNSKFKWLMDNEIFNGIAVSVGSLEKNAWKC